MWSNPLLAGAVPVLDLGWGSVFREWSRSPLCLLARPLRVGFLLCRDPPLPVHLGWGGPSQQLPRSRWSRERSLAWGETRSSKSCARRRSPSRTCSSRAVPLHASSGAVEVEASSLSPLWAFWCRRWSL